MVANSPIYLTTGGAIDALSILRSSWITTIRIGLYQNDQPPSLDWSIADIQPAIFSGVVPPFVVTGWSSPVPDDQGAVIQAPQVSWSHNGGPLSGWVYGYYVVNSVGRLQWFQPIANGPVSMARVGDTVVVTPQFFYGSTLIEVT